MAQLQLQPLPGGKRNRMPLRSLKIDMTPLVDLGFLLITFFIFTTTMSEPTVTNLYMPKDGDATNLGESNALTVLLSAENKVYCYQGKWEDAIQNNSILLTSYNLQTGIGKTIREKQERMGTRRNELMFLIKPSEEASYKNIIDALDEAAINSVTRYAIVEPDAQEVKYLRGAH
jgi:biopolymer transport protein ExbD